MGPPFFWIWLIGFIGLWEFVELVVFVESIGLTQETQ